MKSIIFLFTALCLLSCSQKDDQEKEIKEVYNNGTAFNTFLNNSKLVVTDREGVYTKESAIETGNNIVFEHKFVADDEEGIADDEYYEIIRFEIDANLTEFSYANKALTNINPVLSKYCYCYFPTSPEKSVAPTGSVTGKKQSNNKWEINLNLVFYGDEARNITETFTLKN